MAVSDTFKDKMDELQEHMVKQALALKDTDFDPFYQFIIGKISWEETVEQITRTLKPKIERR